MFLIVLYPSRAIIYLFTVHGLIYLSIYISIHLSIYLSIHLSIHLSIYLFTNTRSVNQLIIQSLYLSVNPSTILSINLSINEGSSWFSYVPIDHFFNNMHFFSVVWWIILRLPQITRSNTFLCNLFLWGFCGH